VTATEGGKAEIPCVLLVGNEKNENIEWIWEVKNKDEEGTFRVLEEEEGRFSFINSQTESKLIISNITLEDKGTYKCIAKNTHGNESRTVGLRVKSIKFIYFFLVYLYIFQILKLVIKVNLHLFGLLLELLLS
jgi:hypothetical protein